MLAESLVQDLRYACRGLRRSPFFAASAAGTIGIGLGILCSAFTIVNAYLFKAVNLPQPHELYGLSWDTAAQQRHEFSLADFDALAEDNPVFADVAAGRGVAATRNGTPIFGHVVSRDYFTVMRGPAALGRPIARTDFVTPAHGAVVVLSHEAWRTHFRADASIVGQEITLVNTRFVVIGVTRAGATLPGDETISFWVPMTMAAVFGGLDATQDATRSLFVVGRRHAEVSPEQVRAWFDTWLRQRFRSDPDLTPTRTRVDSLATRIPVNRGTLTVFSLLTAAFGLVLLVACANVTNMLLARGLGRQRELGVRVSLGASRWQIVRQLMVESLLLSVPAAAVGLALTMATARMFPRLVTTTIPAGAQVASLFLAPFDPDVHVLALLTGAGVLAALLAGLSPAVQLTRVNLVDAMRGQIGPSTRIAHARTAFVAVQIATCVLFLVAAIGLVVESSRMASDETGLEYERVLDLRAPANVRPAIAAELAARGDVEQVVAVWRPPLISPMASLRVRPLPGSQQLNAGFMAVSPEYFSALGVQIRQGRGFSLLEAEQDLAVVVVSDATARAFWPQQDPLGQVLEVLPPAAGAPLQPRHSRVTVIGVAEDVTNGTLLDGVAPTTVYFATTAASPQAARLLVRTRGDAATAIKPIADALDAAHPDAAIQIVPLQQHTALQVWAFRAFSAAAVIPAVLGLVLAFAGTYGVVAFVMAQRTREFGIRMALGASAVDIIGGVVGSTVRTGFFAAAFGLAATVAAIRGASAVFDIVPVIGLGIYATSVFVVVLASAVAALLPAMRAVRLNPAIALRAE
jgi:predicted permease